MSWVAAGMAGLVLAGCVATLVPPRFEGFYDPVAAERRPDRNPVIVIPGFLGTRLADADSGAIIWGAVGGNYADPATPEGARLIARSLRANQPSANVQPDGMLDHFRFRTLPLRFKPYNEILRALGEAGYRDEDLSRRDVDFGDSHLNSFQFSYDWRLDNADNARRLDDFIRQKTAYCRSDRQRRGLPPREVRFDIIAHSMGGLLTRYYLRYGAQPLPEDGSLPELTWAGARHVERVILVAPPNGGAVKAVLNMIRGVRHAPGLPFYDALLNGTFPSPYQLFPRARHGAIVDARDPSRSLNLLDPELWERAGWGLASRDKDELLQWLLPDVEDPDERHRLALDYLRDMLRRADQFQRALDLPAATPAGIGIFLLAGDAIETPSVLAIDPESGEVEVVAHALGDGSVLKASALMSGWTTAKAESGSPIDWQDAIFTSRKHSRLSGGAVFADRIDHWLLELPRATSAQRSTSGEPLEAAGVDEVEDHERIHDSSPGR